MDAYKTHDVVDRFVKLAVPVDSSLKRPVDEDKAYAIYNGYLKPIEDTIKFFKGEESKGPSKKLDAAFLAAGGDSAQVVPDKVSKPSNILYGHEYKGLEFIVGPQLLNLESYNGDVIEALMQLSKDGFSWDKKFVKAILILKEKTQKAKQAFAT